MGHYLSNKKFFLAYFVIIVVDILFVYSYNFPKALDIVRYYEITNKLVKHFSIQEYLYYTINKNIDFIYLVGLFIFKKVGISLNLFTCFWVCLYHLLIARIVLFIEKKNVFKYPPIYYLLFSAPIIWVISISRNLTAIVFFYLAIYFFIRERNKLIVFLCFVAAIFTHFSLVVYVFLFYVALIISKVDISRKFSNISFIVIVFLGYIIPELFQNYLSDIFTNFQDVEMGSRYVQYAERKWDSIFNSKYVGIGDKLPTLFFYLLTISLVLLDKQRNTLYWMFYILAVVLCVFIHANVMMTQRLIMILPLFVAVSMYSVVKRNKVLYNIYNWLAILGFVIMCGAIYTYRTAFF